MIRRKHILILSLFSIFIAIPSILNGQVKVLQPGIVPNQSVYDTLGWRALKEPTLNFWDKAIGQGDSIAVWFKPDGPCSLIAIRFHPYNFEGTCLFHVWDGSHYDGHITTTDSTDSNGWIGDFEGGEWISGRVMNHSPIGWNDEDPAHHYWGLLPLTVVEALTGQWIEIHAATAMQGEIDLGNNSFFISITLYQTAGGGMAGENEETTPYHTFCFYNNFEWGASPDSKHFGWFIHSASVWIEAIVKYYDVTSVEVNNNVDKLSSFHLYQNYPNPFNQTTDIRYEILVSRYPTHITLKIFNILGQDVRTLVDGAHQPGYYTVPWDGKDSSGKEVSSGIYMYRLQAGDLIETKEMLFLK